MSYCTLNDLIDAYTERDIIQLTDRTNKPPTTINTELVDKAIADADGEINLYLMARYKLPLASVPHTIRRIAVVLAYRNLHSKIDDEHAAQQAARRQSKLLDGIATGKLSLGIDPAGAAMPINNTVQITPGRNDWERGKY